MNLKKIQQKISGFVQRLKEKPVPAFIFRVVEEIGKDNAGDMAAGIAYYAFLSIFPLLLGIIAALGLFLPSDTVQSYIFDFSEQYLPASRGLIERNVNSIIDARGALGILSIIGLFWTGSAIFAAVGRVINRAWNIRTLRPFYIRKLRDLTLAFLTGILFLLSMAVNTLSSVIPRIDFPVLESLTVILGRVVGFGLIFVVFIILFKFIPNAKTSWRYVWPGALFTALVFEIARSVFTIYLSNFASYDMVYGSLAAVIILLVWIYFSAFIIIIGTEFTSEYTRLRSASRG